MPRCRWARTPLQLLGTNRTGARNAGSARTPPRRRASPPASGVETTATVERPTACVALVIAALRGRRRRRQCVALSNPVASTAGKRADHQEAASAADDRRAVPLATPSRDKSGDETMTLPLFQVDAFADRPFAGNPAAVCLLDRPGDPAWMQNVGREMNLSETAFLARQADGYDLRWFTPAVEVDLCGRATCGILRAGGAGERAGCRGALRRPESLRLSGGGGIGPGGARLAAGLRCAARVAGARVDGDRRRRRSPL